MALTIIPYFCTIYPYGSSSMSVPNNLPNFKVTLI